MGKVYRAHRTRLGDIVAIKFITRNGGDLRALEKRFMHEARMCAVLRHPHIVSVLDFGIETGIGPYLVMEYLNGPSLKQQLHDRGAFDVSDVCRIAAQIGSALDLAHSQDIVHRDLKPGNILLTRSGVKVLDFQHVIRHCSILVSISVWFAIPAEAGIQGRPAAPPGPWIPASAGMTGRGRGERGDYPTEPSSEIPTSFWASTANSIGSCCSTSRQKPLTTRATASSSPMPRWRQ